AIEWSYADQVTVRGKGDEPLRTYDCAEGSFLERRYRNLIGAIEGRHDRLDVGIASARLFTLVANGAFESAERIRSVPDEYVLRSAEGDQPGAYIDGIEATTKEAFAAGKLYSELGVPWAEPTAPFDLEGYRSFPQRFRLDD
ncbi:MAG TPA: hypothetical protein VEZ72_23765, partial [Paenibacillus sp.]|nr:hypothetical protein [Paenibacillus sp.]